MTFRRGRVEQSSVWHPWVAVVPGGGGGGVTCLVRGGKSQGTGSGTVQLWVRRRWIRVSSPEKFSESSAVLMWAEGERAPHKELHK